MVNVTDVEGVIPGKWMVNRCKLATAGAGFLIVSEPCWRNSHWAVRWGAILPARIENAYEFLDSPGQWYFDRHSGFVYSIPRLGEDMSTIDVVAPGLTRLLLAYSHTTSPSLISSSWMLAGWALTDPTNMSVCRLDIIRLARRVC